MKVYKEQDEFNEGLPVEDREKISLLKLVKVGEYVKGIGIRTKHQYLIPESDHDTERLKTLYSNIGNKKQKIRMLSSMSKGTI